MSEEIEINVRLTPTASREFERLMQLTGLTKENLVRSAITHERAIIEAYDQGKRVCIESRSMDRKAGTTTTTYSEIPKGKPYF